MKSTIINKIFLTAVLAGIICTGIVSCKKFNDWNADENYDRLFRPTELQGIVDGVTVTLRWKPKPSTNSYTIELSKDSLQFATITKSYTATGTKDADGYINYVIPELLEPLTRMSARVRGLDTTEETGASEWAAVTFKTATEQIMTTVTDSDKTPYTVTLKWKVPNQVTHFMLVNDQGAGTKYDIADAEKTAGSKTISSLTPTKTYTALLYYNTSIRGSQAFTLPADLPSGPNVVLVGATDDLATLITNVATGTMFVLRQGTRYTTDNPIIIPNGVSFTIWGESGANKPILAFNGFTLPASAGTIKFENLDITGYQDANTSLTKRNYIFNQSTASNTSEIIFENCTIRNLVNSPMRIQSANAITIDKFTVNKCMVYDIGDNGSNGTYAFINNNVATGKINNITITNSSFAKIGYGLVLHNLAPSVTLNVSNNTFYNVVGNARYFIDYNAQAISGGFTFQNNILAKTLSPAATARGIRAGTAATVASNYKALDVTFAGNAISNIIDYTKPAADLFTDPDNNNFLIKDNTFAGRSDSGDPRWRL
ncbi:DUF5123 domain-containing protein [Niastella caeni]|uniref:DUF5123 domain-containing protein n=1 Tax=Niastella caeni TaxID=2569763 RepID=A0A4S8HGH9_9BACT|nr:DUF5123 domain-containing protein [Niastella caeni]THU34127.1 DUF5123 domain-containing protein [Niastella caeni]